jgi:uncharacterized membrane protein YphA (DoxX/SURF4 family)
MSTSELTNSFGYSLITETEQQTSRVNTRQHLAKRIIFRFTFAYFVLINLPFPLNYIPFTKPLVKGYDQLWHVIVPWVGRHILHLSYDITVFTNGSGDTTFDYVQLLCCLTLAAAATLIWSLFDRRRYGYERLYQWLRIYIRFSLASTMIIYGAVKVIKIQFPDPSLDRLLQPIGDASPMGLLWTFMGASKGYTFFAGAAEILGGLLLILPRTTTLGALVSISVLINIVMLNFCYDVPVKLFSSHLLAMAVFLLAPDLKRLADLFLLNRRVEPIEFPPLFTRKWLNRGALVLQIVFVIYVVGFSFFRTYEQRRTYGDLAAKPPLYGIWSVDEFEVDGEVRPALITDETRWRRVVFNNPGMLAIQFMSDSRQRFKLYLNLAEKKLVLGKLDDPNWKADFSFTEPEQGLIRLEGALDGRRLRAKLRRTEAPQFRLTSRGFHWINEYPFNR